MVFLTNTWTSDPAWHELCPAMMDCSLVICLLSDQFGVFQITGLGLWKLSKNASHAIYIYVERGTGRVSLTLQLSYCAPSKRNPLADCQKPFMRCCWLQGSKAFAFLGLRSASCCYFSLCFSFFNEFMQQIIFLLIYFLTTEVGVFLQ